MNVLGDKAAALLSFELAIKASPGYYQAYKAKGQIYYALGEKK